MIYIVEKEINEVFNLDIEEIQISKKKLTGLNINGIDNKQLEELLSNDEITIIGFSNSRPWIQHILAGNIHTENIQSDSLSVKINPNRKDSIIVLGENVSWLYVVEDKLDIDYDKATKFSLNDYIGKLLLTGIPQEHMMNVNCKPDISNISKLTYTDTDNDIEHYYAKSKTEIFLKFSSIKFNDDLATIELDCTSKYHISGKMKFHIGNVQERVIGNYRSLSISINDSIIDEDIIENFRLAYTPYWRSVIESIYKICCYEGV